MKVKFSNLFFNILYVHTYNNPNTNRNNLIKITFDLIADDDDRVDLGELNLPIYINTSKVIPTITKTPLTLYADLFGLEVVKNTGKYSN